jgi:hypothetical protein
MPKTKWINDIGEFLRNWVTAVLSGAFLAGAFYEATFDAPTMITRLIIIVSTFFLGWYFCRKFYEVEIQKGGMYDDSRKQLTIPATTKQQLNG